MTNAEKYLCFSAEWEFLLQSKPFHFMVLFLRTTHLCVCVEQMKKIHCFDHMVIQNFKCRHSNGCSLYSVRYSPSIIIRLRCDSNERTEWLSMWYKNINSFYCSRPYSFLTPLAIVFSEQSVSKNVILFFCGLHISEHDVWKYICESMVKT